jgi:hypothetical protein
MPYCLYRDNPFRVYFTGYGFQRPRRDEWRRPRTYKSIAAASLIALHLYHENGVFPAIAKIEFLKRRMKYDFDI